MFKNYGLSIVLFCLFIFSWVGQGIFQWDEMLKEAQTHNQSFSVSEFIPAFFSATFENWQSEFLQLLTFVTLTTYLIHKGSPESKDGDERMEHKIDEILKLTRRKTK